MSLKTSGIMNKLFQVIENNDNERNIRNSGIGESSGVGAFLNTYFKFNWTVSKLLEILFVVIICIGLIGNVINIYIFSKRNM